MGGRRMPHGPQHCGARRWAAAWALRGRRERAQRRRAAGIRCRRVDLGIREDMAHGLPDGKGRRRACGHTRRADPMMCRGAYWSRRATAGPPDLPRFLGFPQLLPITSRRPASRAERNLSIPVLSSGRSGAARHVSLASGVSNLDSTPRWSRVVNPWPAVDLRSDSPRPAGRRRRLSDDQPWPVRRRHRSRTVRVDHVV